MAVLGAIPCVGRDDEPALAALNPGLVLALVQADVDDTSREEGIPAGQ
jgi:hypothetical protein